MRCRHPIERTGRGLDQSTGGGQGHASSVSTPVVRAEAIEQLGTPTRASLSSRSFGGGCVAVCFGGVPLVGWVRGPFGLSCGCPWGVGRPHTIPSPAVGGGGVGPRPFFFMLCARRCPTLPHPGGCSTIGAGGLSFRVRNGAGRGSPAMTTETSCRAVHDPHPVVGGGLVLGLVLDRIVDAQRCFLCFTAPYRVVGGGVVVCVGQLVPVSSNPCGSSTSGLSTQWSAGGLPPPEGGVDTSS